MNRKPFVIIIFLSILYCVLTVVESGIYQSWKEASDEQTQIQAKLVKASQLNEVTQRLLRRIAIDSLNDEALAQILTKHGLKVTLSNSPVSNSSSAPASNNVHIPPTSETTRPASAAPGALHP